MHQAVHIAPPMVQQVFEDFRVDGYLTGGRHADERIDFFPVGQRFDFVNQAIRHACAQVFSDNELLRRIFGTQKQKAFAAVAEAVEDGK